MTPPVQPLTAGQVYDWTASNSTVIPFRISRTAKDGSWADIAVLGGAREDQVLWTKRQPWPLAGAVLRVEPTQPPTDRKESTR